jgi:hypothetical protein
MSRKGAKCAKRNIHSSIVLSNYLFQRTALNKGKIKEILGGRPIAFFAAWRETPG